MLLISVLALVAMRNNEIINFLAFRSIKPQAQKNVSMILFTIVVFSISSDLGFVYKGNVNDPELAPYYYN